MRFLKRLLVAVYIYMGVFGVACFVGWCVTGSEPSALIAGMCAATGVESIIGGLMRIREINAETGRAELEAKTYGTIKHNEDPLSGGGSEDIP